jgi:hypothetical protein
MSEVIVFYAGQVYSEHPSVQDYIEQMRALIGSEIYNGSYVWFRHDSVRKHWYRMDNTPMLLEDVPKALRAWVLVLS